MDLQTLIRKLELNESAISTALGGLVMLVVVVLLLNYFQVSRDDNEATGGGTESVGSVSGDLDLADTSISQNQQGQISATGVQKYTVQTGESLWQIAQAHYNDGYKWVDIARANNLANADQIEIGQEIDLPVVSQTNTAQTPSPRAIPNNYIVQRNDSLWEIAGSIYGDNYRWADIWHANQDQIANPDILLIGQLLNLPQ